MEHRWLANCASAACAPGPGWATSTPTLSCCGTQANTPPLIGFRFASQRSTVPVQATSRPQFADNSLPRALLTLGSSVGDPDLSAAIAGSLADAAVNVLITDQPPADRGASSRIWHLGFVPLARLLPDVDLVVSAGGTGTMLMPGLERGLLPLALLRADVMGRTRR